MGACESTKSLFFIDTNYDSTEEPFGLDVKWAIKLPWLGPKASPVTTPDSHSELIVISRQPFISDNYTLSVCLSTSVRLSVYVCLSVNSWHGGTFGLWGLLSILTLKALNHHDHQI